MQTTPTLSIIGQGAFGTALYKVFRAAGFDTSLHGREFSRNLTASIVLLAVPSNAVESVLEKLSLNPHQILILCCKGLLSNGQVPSSLLPKQSNYAILSGPGFANQLGALHPTIHSVASPDPQQAKALAKTLSTASLRLYWSTDVLGVQLCGALKNPIAIAAGMAHGLGFTENTCAAITTRGANEIQQIVSYWGGKTETLMSPAGIGDILLTCSSSSSRNFRFGEKIARDNNVKQAEASIGTVEGLGALKGLIAADLPLDLPLIRCLNDIIKGDLTPRQGVQRLMERPIISG